MKQIVVLILSAMLLAVPATMSGRTSLPSSVQDKKVKKTVTVVYKVNMHCKSCVNKLTENLSFIKGVVDLKISLDNKTVAITYDPAKTNEAALVKAIEKCGYSAEKIKPLQ